MSKKKAAKPAVLNETKLEKIKRLRSEVLSEAKLIANGLTESCYTLVEKSKKLQALDPDDLYEDVTDELGEIEEDDPESDDDDGDDKK